MALSVTVALEQGPQGHLVVRTLILQLLEDETIQQSEGEPGWPGVRAGWPGIRWQRLLSRIGDLGQQLFTNHAEVLQYLKNLAAEPMESMQPDPSHSDCISLSQLGGPITKDHKSFSHSSGGWEA